MSIENLKRHRAGVETINGVIKTINRLDSAARTLGNERLSTTFMYIADDLVNALTDLCESFDDEQKLSLEEIHNLNAIITRKEK